MTEDKILEHFVNKYKFFNREDMKRLKKIIEAEKERKIVLILGSIVDKIKNSQNGCVLLTDQEHHLAHKVGL